MDNTGDRPAHSGKSYLARRLLKTVKDSVRINPDELRLMYFDDAAPIHDEELVYHTLSNLRKFAIDHHHSVIIDSTAPDTLRGSSSSPTGTIAGTLSW